MYLSVSDGQVQQQALGADGTIAQTWAQDPDGRIVLIADPTKALGGSSENNAQVVLVDKDAGIKWTALDVGSANSGPQKVYPTDFSPELYLTFTWQQGVKPTAGFPFFISHEFPANFVTVPVAE